jgi:hypothetical protein
MKTLFVIDQLVKQDNPSYLLELLLSLDAEATIFTLAYDPEIWRGRFIQHRVVASPISHLVKKPEDLKKYEWMIPSMGSKLPWPETVENIIVITSGFAHTLVPKKFRTQSYLYLAGMPKVQFSGWRKLFTPYLKHLSQSALYDYPQVAVAHQDWKSLTAGAQFIAPTYPTMEFSTVMGEEPPQKILVHTNGLNFSEAQSIMNIFPAAEFFGKENTSLKLPAEKYLGDHCEGTLSGLQLQSLAVFDLSGERFPVKALQAQLAGRPVVVRESVDKTYLSDGVFWSLPEKFSLHDLETIKMNLDQNAYGVDRASLRRKALKWNERFFKTQFQFFMRGELH